MPGVAVQSPALPLVVQQGVEQHAQAFAMRGGVASGAGLVPLARSGHRVAADGELSIKVLLNVGLRAAVRP
jgi:hypothetical protein